MNVLFLSYAKISLEREGGIRAISMLRALADAGHSVSLVAPETDFPTHPNIQKWMDAKGRPPCRTQLQLASVRAMGTTAFSAVHALGEAVFFAAHLCRWKKIPLVYDAARCMGGSAGYAATGLGQFFPRYILRRQIKVLKQAHLTFSSCTALTADLRYRHVTDSILQVADVPVQSLCTALEMDRTSLQERFGKSLELVVVCCALPGHKIGLRHVLLAARKVIDTLPKSTFFFKGFPREKAEGMALNLAISDRCVFLETDDTEAFLAVLEVAQVTLLIPEHDGRYVHAAVYTLLHAGVPLVALHSSGYDELLTEKTSIRVLPHTESIAEGLLHVLQEPLFYFEIAREGQQLVADRHTYSSFKYKVRMAYHAALA